MAGRLEAGQLFRVAMDLMRNGLLNGAPLVAAAEAELLNAACQVAFGETWTPSPPPIFSL